MSRNFKFSVPAVVGLAILALVVNCSTGQDSQAAGGEADVEFANNLWTVLKSAKLVGEDRIQSHPFAGNEPHGAIQQVLGTTATVGGRSARVLVKVNHGGEGVTVKSVYDNPNKSIGAYTVMFKREAGYDTENMDWFWAKFKPDGTLDKNPKGIQLAGRIGKGGTAGCIPCHRALGGKDFETLTSR